LQRADLIAFCEYIKENGIKACLGHGPHVHLYQRRNQSLMRSIVFHVEPKEVKGGKREDKRRWKEFKERDRAQQRSKGN